ncbi:uncharacterized protein LOC111888911 [Lactuca sativa]|uniref:uncharacterized protein LOC111888911 n=1 Tax=Lactuca sativa TaxID=4236 RepID=UPI000CD9DD85|nr:uncharacterized protein LOC111888911 [Lactuca sativa]XP_042755769.1 uncharacterized protein LOC111888911 [Lactuca sativa]
MDMSTRETSNQIHDDASSSMTIKTDDVVPWSYLNHDVISLVMMQLGVIDFLAFSGVCKSWRSVARSNWKTFMTSKPPMLMLILPVGNNDRQCWLVDSEGKEFRTIIPHSAGWGCVGLTCGYLILLRWKTYDFWLVNPITRHELHFPPAPCVSDYVSKITSVLFISPSMSKLVFVILASNQIWFSIENEGGWNFVSSTFDFTFKDLHVFKGRIYSVSNKGHFCELTLEPEPKLTLLKTKSLLDEDVSFRELVSWGENIYVRENLMAYKLDFCEMEWVPFQYTGDENEVAFFLSDLSHGAAAKPESWGSEPGRYVVFEGGGKGRFFIAVQWYFPHECLNVNLLHDA